MQNYGAWGEIAGVFEECVAVHYAKNIDTGSSLLEILVLRRKPLEIQFLFLETWSTSQVVLLSRIGPVWMD